MSYPIRNQCLIIFMWGGGNMPKGTKNSKTENKKQQASSSISSSATSSSSSSSSTVASSGVDYVLSSPTSATMSSSSSSSAFDSSGSLYTLSSPSASFTLDKSLSWTAPNAIQSITLSVLKSKDVRIRVQMMPDAWLTLNTCMLISVLNELENTDWSVLLTENKDIYKYQDLLTNKPASAYHLPVLTEQAFIDKFAYFLERIQGEHMRKTVHQLRVKSADLTHQEKLTSFASSSSSYGYYGGDSYYSYGRDSYSRERGVSKTVTVITADNVHPITSFYDMTALDLLELCQYIHSEAKLLNVAIQLSNLLTDDYRSHMKKEKQHLMLRNQTILDLIQMLFIEAIICDGSERQAGLVSQMASMLSFIASYYSDVSNKLNIPFRSLDHENLKIKSIQASRLLSIIDPGEYVSVQSRPSKGKNFLVCATKDENHKKISEIFGYFKSRFIGNVWIGRCFYPSIDKDFVTHILSKIRYSNDPLIFFKYMIYIAIVSEHHKYAFDKEKDLFKEVLDIIGNNSLIGQYNKYFCYQGQISEDVKMIAYAILYHIINTHDSINQRDILCRAIFTRNTTIQLETLDGKEVSCINDALFLSMVTALIVNPKKQHAYLLINSWSILLKLALDFYENVDNFIDFAKSIIAKYPSNIEQLVEYLKKQVLSASHDFIDGLEGYYGVDKNQYACFMRYVGLMFFMYAVKIQPQASSSSTSVLGLFSGSTPPNSAMLTQAAMNVCRAFFMASSRSFQYSINEKSDYKAHMSVSPAEEKLLRPGLLGQSSELSKLFDSISAFVTLTEAAPAIVPHESTAASSSTSPTVAPTTAPSESGSLFTFVTSLFSGQEQNAAAVSIVDTSESREEIHQSDGSDIDQLSSSPTP